MSDLSRVEQLLRNALGEDIYEVTPQSRVEALLVELNELIEGISTSVDPEELTPIITAWLAENIHDGAVVDSSLSVAGAAAESKKTGEEINQLKEDLNVVSGDLDDEIARARAEEARIEALFTQPVEEAVSDWLDDHPEATTTVQDGSLTHEKLVIGTLGFVTPEMFGAKGDGITDDTDALQNSCDSGFPVILSEKTYLINGAVDTNGCCYFVGKNTTIKTSNQNSGYLFTFNNKDVQISGLKFDFENKNALGAIKCINCDNVIISDIEVCNIAEKRTTNGVSGIYVSNPVNCDISNIYVHDCTNVANNVVGDDAGNVTGVRVARFTGKCSIHDSCFENLHSVDINGNIVFEDSNAIYPSELNSDGGSCHIYACAGKDVGKRFIKTQCSCAVIIDNCNYINTKNDFLVGIGIQETESAEQTSKGTGIISNCCLINAAEYNGSTTIPWLISSSENVIVNNCVLKSGYYYAFGGTGNFAISDCDVEGYGFTMPRSNSVINVDGCVFKGGSLFYVNTSANVADMTFKNCDFHHVKYSSVLSYGSTISEDSPSVLNMYGCVFYDISISLGGAVFDFNQCKWNCTRITYFLFSSTSVADKSYIRFCKFLYQGETARVQQYINISNHYLCVESLIFDKSTSSYDAAINSCTMIVRDGVSMRDMYFPQSILDEFTPHWEESQPTRLGFYGDGYKYLNINDGKLYIFDKSTLTWSAVS